MNESFLIIFIVISQFKLGRNDVSLWNVNISSTVLCRAHFQRNILHDEWIFLPNIVQGISIVFDFFFFFQR